MAKSILRNVRESQHLASLDEISSKPIGLETDPES
jgi:hypothetical protein